MKEHRIIPAILLLMLSFSGAGFSLDPLRTTIAPEHPRLLFRSSLCSEGPAPAEVAWRAGRQPYSEWYGRLNTESFHTAALSWLIRSIRGEASYPDTIAEKVVDRMANMPMRDGNFYNGENLHRMSLAYDWLYHYPGFTTEKKRRARENMLTMAGKLLSASDDGETIIWGGDIMHNYCSNAALAVGLAGLALYEGPGDEQAGRLIAIAEDWYFERSFPAFEMLGGGWHEGMAYSLNHYIQETPIWVAAYRSATGIDWFARIKSEQGNWMEGWIYYCLANLRPDYTFTRSSDMGASRMLPRHTLRQAVEIITGAYGNCHGKFLVDELEQRLGDDAISSSDLWMPLIFYDDKLPAVDYRELAPTQVINPGRLGHITMRSGWGPDATFIHFECGDYFGSHNHLDQGQFTIYHRGDLALDSGYYDGYTEHHKKYAYRSIAHNVVLIKDPQEMVPSRRFGQYQNAGGQRALDFYYDNNNTDLATFWEQYRDNAYADMADITSWQTEAGWDYAEGDLTAAYNSTSYYHPGARPKIRRYKRRLLFVKPDILVVYDDVLATRAPFEKKWLLHTVNRPEKVVRGDIAVSEKNGRLVLTPLFPADVRSELVGGPGQEFMVNGFNMPLTNHPDPGYPAKPGAWRIELTPGAPREQDTFVNLMQIGEAGTAPGLSFEAVQSEHLLGGASSTLAVLFTRGGDQAEDEREIELPDGIRPGSRIFVAGLQHDGVYRLYEDGTRLTTLNSGRGGVVMVPEGVVHGGELELRLVERD